MVANEPFAYGAGAISMALCKSVKGLQLTRLSLQTGPAQQAAKSLLWGCGRVLHVGVSYVLLHDFSCRLDDRLGCQST